MQRRRAAGMNIADVRAVVAGAVGGENVGRDRRGRARFPVNLRYPRRSATRRSLSELPILTPPAAAVTLGSIAK